MQPQIEIILMLTKRSLTASIRVEVLKSKLASLRASENQFKPCKAFYGVSQKQFEFALEAWI